MLLFVSITHKKVRFFSAKNDLTHFGPAKANRFELRIELIIIDKDFATNKKNYLNFRNQITDFTQNMNNRLRIFPITTFK